MSDLFEWVMLAYRLPREPSTRRIAVWRKLNRLGVAHLVDSLVALPADAHTKEQLEWIADEVIAAGGTASVWIARPASAAVQRQTATLMAETIAAEYRSVITEAETARSAEVDGRRRAHTRLRREVERIGRRDFFPPPEREIARQAVRELGRLVEVER